MWCLHNNTWNWWATVVPWIRGYGGDVLSTDGTKSTLSTPESLAGLQAYVDLWTKYDIAVPLGSEFGGDCFLLEKCAVYFHIPGQRAWLRENVGDKFEWDVALMPAHPKGRFTGMGTYGFAISAQTKHPEAAWDFVKYLASATGQRIIARCYAGIPLLKSMADDPAWRELPPPPTNNEAFLKGADIGILPRTYPLECGSLYTGQVNQVISGALERSIRGQTTVEEAFGAAEAEIQACLDKVYKK
jgi:multiple sugar transport system substrate-binding protein